MLRITCVCANVSSEQPRPGEGLATGGAHAGQSVRANVHLQGSQAGVLLGAVFAVEGWASGDLSGQGGCMLRLNTGGELVVGEG